VQTKIITGSACSERYNDACSGVLFGSDQLFELIDLVLIARMHWHFSPLDSNAEVQKGRHA